MKGMKQPKLRKDYRLISPCGQIFIVNGLSEFCEKRNLNTGNLSSVANGILNHLKGWLCEKL